MANESSDSRPAAWNDVETDGITGALVRAARRAHLIAHQSGTGVVVMRAGKVVEIEPDPEMYGDLLSKPPRAEDQSAVWEETSKNSEQSRSASLPHRSRHSRESRNPRRGNAPWEVPYRKPGKPASRGEFPASIDMMEGPPYSMTSAILALAEQVGEAIGCAEAAVSTDLRRRRINRIRTIRGSLAIEGNTLTEAQIATILDGKPVIAPLREVQEVRNAIRAYDEYRHWNPADEAHLLRAHEILMAGLLDVPGHYRRGPVAVMERGEVQHLGPPADRVPHLMANLLEWLCATGEHPLVASSVFHYEFEFIHPFEDGNGRMGRLWQTLILSRWNPLFAHVPVESLIHARQNESYEAIRESSARGESTPFIEYMLEIILAALSAPQETPPVTLQVGRLLSVMEGEMSRREILHALGLSDRKSLRQRYLLPALERGYVEMTHPNTPHARNQKYRLTAKGRQVQQGGR